MKPQQQKILAQLGKENQKKAEEKLEKVDLAMNPSQLLKYIDKMDADLKKSEQKIEKSFTQYKKAYNQWKTTLDDISDRFVKGGTEFGQIVKKLNELGVKPNNSPELVKANERLEKVRALFTNLDSLYQEPK
jgi:DNA repair ATPase RecN